MLIIYCFDSNDQSKSLNNQFNNENIKDTTKNRFAKEKPFRERMQLTDRCIKDSTIHAGFMYWYKVNIFESKPELVVLGEVIKVDSLVHSDDPTYPATQFGKLKISKILYHSSNLSNLKQFEYITSNNYFNVKNGDSIIIFLEYYDGCFGIPFYGIDLGIVLSKNSNSISSKGKDFINLLQMNNPWDKKVLSKKQLELWDKFYPAGAIIKNRLEY